SLSETKALDLLTYWQLPTSRLLNHNLLLLGIDSALRILCGHSNYALSRRQRRSEVVKAAVIGYHRHFPAIHHDPGARFGFAGHFDHMSVLNKRVQIQVNGVRILPFGNYVVLVILVFYRIFIFIVLIL